MSLVANKDGDTLVLSVESTRIDSASAIAFKDEMFNATRGTQGRVILDLTKVDFVDSSGLGAIVASMKALGDAAKMDIAGLSPVVEKVFRLTRMDSVFRIFPDLPSAQTATPA